jgi:hypothetical protein
MRAHYGCVAALTLVASCALSRGPRSPEEVSASDLGLTNCPAAMLSALPADAAKADWRLIRTEDVRYCVPATWTIRQDQLKRYPSSMNVWSGEGGGVATRYSSTLDMDWPRAQLAPGMVNDLSEQKIAGTSVEIFHRPVRQPATSREVRSTTYTGGYETYAIWREKNVYFHGWARDLGTVSKMKLVFLTARFGAVDTSE